MGSKSFIFSNETIDLNKKNSTALEETQKSIAKLILSLHKDLKETQLWLMGDPKLKNAVFTPFWNIVANTSNEQKGRICHLKHPSYRGFANDILTTINEYKLMKGKTK